MRALTILLATSLAALAVALPAGASSGRPPSPAELARCHRLTPTHHLRRVHLRLRQPGQTIHGPLGRILYGRCGARWYAFASFSLRTHGTNFGLQDQPERFRRRTGGHWHDRGDTGGDICGLAPRALLRAWGRRCAVPAS